MTVYRLENQVQHYDWGSPTVLPELLGYPPDGTPAAELWMGVHPGAPSMVVSPGPRRPLADLIADDPQRSLGRPVAARFDALPFLLKILAVDRPLSLQAHPNLEQARAGYADEQDRGVAPDSAERNYRDANHKPEMICAMTEFEGLCGFRRVTDTVRLLEELGDTVSRRYRDRLLAPGGLREVVTSILTAPAAVVADQVAEVAAAAAALVERGSGFAAEAAWLAKLAEDYPGDRGVLIAALLNLVRLPPGAVLSVRAGQLHAYLGGVGVEIMATSDNVLRGGLTSKHIDVGELVRILDLHEEVDPPVQGPRTAAELPASAGGWQDYSSDVPDFRLSRAELSAVGTVEAVRASGAAQILLCTAGAAEVVADDGTVSALPAGASVFVPATDEVRVRPAAGGLAVVFAATTNMG